MKPEQQRIAIAEACGWTEISDWKAAGINGKHPTEPWTEVIPDYLTDLNVMHEAEKVLTRDQLHTYLFELHKIINRNHIKRYAVCATAALRAEAFLRTIGKWEEA